MDILIYCIIRRSSSIFVGRINLLRWTPAYFWHSSPAVWFWNLFFVASIELFRWWHPLFGRFGRFNRPNSGVHPVQGLGLMSLLGDWFHITFKYVVECLSPTVGWCETLGHLPTAVYYPNISQSFFQSIWFPYGDFHKSAVGATGCQTNSGCVRGFLWLRGKDLRRTLESNCALGGFCPTRRVCG